ncbi:hypothetical protein DEV91_105223 [Phyllobacterium brassicacearum]|nr:hypothetical protein DEV91_105223 [Phyllobacterium brassicacearum]
MVHPTTAIENSPIPITLAILTEVPLFHEHAQIRSHSGMRHQAEHCFKHCSMGFSLFPARVDEKWKNVDKRFDDLDKKIEKVSGILSKIMWLFVSAMILGFVAFIINGGLRVP